MRVAIVHYHLRRGGVTRVIAHATEALRGKAECVVLASTDSEEALDAPVASVPELAYREDARPGDEQVLLQKMKTAAREALGADPDVWHIHNHSLGKNTVFPATLRLLAEEGAPILLQIHDFAEEGRPLNYTRQQRPFLEGTFTERELSLYPTAPQIHYALLTQRDVTHLSRAGFPEDRLHLLPNAVTAELPPPKEAPPVTNRFLYPTRAIRRKNVGEVLLLAQSNPQARFATTLSPKIAQWEGIHDHWRATARELDLPMEFAIGEEPGASFPDLVQSAAALITTSVGEGFGLAFLEPWLFGKSVAGRDLPDITADFKASGIGFADTLYAECRVPLGTFKVKAQFQRYREAIRTTFKAYGMGISDKEVQSAWEQLTEGEMIDFGQLDETGQTEVLRSGFALDDSANPLNHLAGDAAIAGNAGRIRELYGLTRYGDRLHSLYTELMKAPAAPPSALDPDALLRRFLSPAAFRLLLS
jgi:glycosyltransferase involved in cell wall biosynthesis